MTRYAGCRRSGKLFLIVMGATVTEVFLCPEICQSLEYQKSGAYMIMEEFQVDFVTDDDKTDWRPLFEGYAAFYKTAIDDDIVERVWSWLLAPDHVLEGLIVRNSSGLAVGMAHVRACPRTLAGGYIGFLDDMFVVPEARGTGAADAIFSHLNTLARERGWTALRWITQHFNERGRGFYDRYTDGPSDFIVYQLKAD